MQFGDILLAEHVLCCSSCYVLYASVLLDESGRCPECARSANLPLLHSKEVFV